MYADRLNLYKSSISLCSVVVLLCTGHKWLCKTTSTWNVSIPKTVWTVFSNRIFHPPWRMLDLRHQCRSLGVQPIKEGFLPHSYFFACLFFSILLLIKKTPSLTNTLTLPSIWLLLEDSFTLLNCEWCVRIRTISGKRSFFSERSFITFASGMI